MGCQCLPPGDPTEADVGESRSLIENQQLDRLDIRLQTEREGRLGLNEHFLSPHLLECRQLISYLGLSDENKLLSPDHPFWPMSIPAFLEAPPKETTNKQVAPITEMHLER